MRRGKRGMRLCWRGVSRVVLVGTGWEKGGGVRCMGDDDHAKQRNEFERNP